MHVIDYECHKKFALNLLRGIMNCYLVKYLYTL